MIHRRPLSRRTVLAAAATGVGVAAVGRDLAVAADATVKPISMAMHIHGPFSEGGASFEAHLHQARDLGVDLVW